MSHQIPVEIPFNSGISLSHPVNSSFVGLSLEPSGLEYFLGNGSAPNDFFLKLMSELSGEHKTTVSMRVGGNTQDDTWYDSACVSSLIRKQGDQEGVTFGPSMFDHLANISSTVPFQWIVGLNFNSTTVAQPQHALDMAQTIEQKFGDKVYAFEIGNEPDRYESMKLREPVWNISNYVDQWLEYAQKLQQVAPGATSRGLEAAAFGSNWDIANLVYHKTKENKTFLENYQPMIRSISKHQYQASSCNANMVPTVNDLLNHTSIVAKVQYAIRNIHPKDLISTEFRLGEFNSISCEGHHGVSDTFASALWVIDYMLSLANHNVTACNLHNRYPSVYNIADKGDNGWYAQPLYYGMQFVRKALGDNSGENVEIASIQTTEPDVVAYAVYRKKVMRNIVLLSMQKYEGEGNSQPPRNVSLIFKDLKEQTVAQPLHVWALTAPSAVSQHGIRWANQTMDGSKDGTFQGKRSTITVHPQQENGAITYSVSVSPVSAHLLVFNPPGQKLFSAAERTSSFTNIYIAAVAAVSIILTYNF
ncbi:hypothetical protein INT43_004180 [Umbelopsis isabellina]|uniref:Beta-glucuronidase C-terminal domain-containing protein n=1 Tax=Mortierella isabellina TaxID=91625 RepID=A0A8H7PI49_MORIS|nr:hypothetical protein INT43_004180 [Umbelopsis isabellina]